MARVLDAAHHLPRPMLIYPIPAERRAQTRHRRTLAAVSPGARGFMDEVGSSTAVSVRDLVKRYPRSPVNAVDGVSFDVGRQEIFGLLGPNGAGKTTTVGVLTTRVRPTTGPPRSPGSTSSATCPRSQRAARVPEQPRPGALDPRQPVFHAAYHGVPAGERTPRRRAARAVRAARARAGSRTCSLRRSVAARDDRAP
jgi:ABC-2 type transport system ATP-binding protein